MHTLWISVEVEESGWILKTGPENEDAFLNLAPDKACPWRCNEMGLGCVKEKPESDYVGKV